MPCQVGSNAEQGVYCTSCPFAGQRCISNKEGSAGISWKGLYREASTYSQHDMVEYQGRLWRLKCGVLTGLAPGWASTRDLWEDMGAASPYPKGSLALSDWNDSFPFPHPPPPVPPLPVLSQEQADELRGKLSDALRVNQVREQVLEHLLELKEKERMELGPVTPEVRIGDTVRNKYADHLSNMLSDGVLTWDEFEVRLNKTGEAKYERDLKTLVEDLPPMPPPPPPPFSPMVQAVGHVARRPVFSNWASAVIGTATVVMWVLFLLVTLGVI